MAAADRPSSSLLAAAGADQQDEATLLASLGTSTALTTEYESNVLHQATLATAPRLDGASMPDLMGLAPTFGLAAGQGSGNNNSSNSSRKRRRRTESREEEMQCLMDVLVETRTELSDLIAGQRQRPQPRRQSRGRKRGGGSGSSSSGTSAPEEEEQGGGSESRPANLLRLKQQMILQYLFQHCGYAPNEHERVWDIVRERSGYDGRVEKEEERDRRALIVAAAAAQAAASARAAADASAAAADGSGYDRGVKDDGDDGMVLEEEESIRGRKGPSNNASKGRRWKEPPESQLPHAGPSYDGMTAQQRLEQIKKDGGGEAARRVVTFAPSSSSAATTSSASSSPTKRRKASMMAIRQQMDIDSGVARQRRDNADDVERRRRKREERRERRRLRTERILGKFVDGRREKRRSAAAATAGAAVSTGSSRKDADGSDSDEVEFEFEGETNAASNINPAEAATAEEPADAVAPEEPAAPRSPQQTVSCPLCGDDIDVAADEDADTALSGHIDECQRRRGGRPSRRSVRSRAVISYAEDAHDDDDDEDDDGEEKKSSEPASAASSKSRSSARSSPRKRPSSSSDSYDSDSVLSPSSPPPDFDPSDYLDITGDDELDNLPFHTAPDDLDESNYDDRVDVWQEVGVQKMKDMSELDDDNHEPPPGAILYDGDLAVPGWMNNRLFGYQRTGLRWMWELHKQQAGGIVGDEMGLGKTVQVCSFLGAMTACRKLNSVLVICPATMLRHWMSELAVWAPGIRRILIHKSGETDGLTREVSGMLLRRLDKWLKRVRDDRVNEAIDDKDYDEYDEDVFCGTGYAVVTTYDAIRRNPDVWTNHRWSTVVMDEGQKIRNPDADVTLACKRFRTPHRLLLSGTPIQNDLRELWSLFDFVFPGRLGVLPAFEAEFADPIRRGGYTNASPMQVQLAYRCAMVLRDLINPYLLRRQKKDIKEVSRLPGKTEQVLFCRLSNRQRLMYESYLRSDDVQNALRGSNQTFKAITVLRKICNHPDLVTGPNRASYESFLQHGYANDDDDLSTSSDEDEYDDDDDAGGGESMITRSGKLEVLAKILPLWKKQGHRVLIFCQWTKMLSIIEKFVNMQGWKFGRLDGKTNIASRQKLVDTFNNDDRYFGMLLTTRTGGVGLNLVGANRIILYDPDWNPQTDAQARERAWRFGQKKQVTVYRLITAGAIEERIYHRQIFKNAISSAVLVDPKQRRLFSQKDLRDLFTLKADVGSVAKGGDGVTETGELTKGAGVIDPDATDAAQEENAIGSKKDNQDTLEVVMKSKGLAGIFDHDVVVDKPSSRRSASAREMEEQAANVANNAVRALRESTAGQQQDFEPTWTGTSGAQPRRFGGGRGSCRGRGSGGSFSAAASGAETPFGGAGHAGIASSSQTSRATSSGALLSHLHQRNSATAASSRVGTSSGDASSNSELIQRIKAFIRRKGRTREGGGPNTDQLLSEFDSVPNHDAVAFRRMLLSVAKRGGDGRWRLK